MKRSWTDLTAIAAVSKANGATVKEKEKCIFIKHGKGLSGLTACSAYSYLVNHCGYRMALVSG